MDLGGVRSFLKFHSFHFPHEQERQQGQPLSTASAARGWDVRKEFGLSARRSALRVSFGTAPKGIKLALVLDGKTRPKKV